jgi:hypothetical protein
MVSEMAFQWRLIQIRTFINSQIHVQLLRHA